MLTLTGEDIPEQLWTIPGAPTALYISGKLSQALRQPLLAVVGSRKTSSYGRQITAQLVREVAGRGITIVSGLALGVDGIAHQAALEAQTSTVAVLPCGLDTIYPRSHFHLGKQILESGGVLLSEYPEGTPPLRQHFIERNRLVSGLADAVLITEAAEKSGTLHTASFALDQGKTVLAVPGNITSDLSKGTNNLLKAGAQLVTETADILHALGIDPTTRAHHDLFGDTEDETRILQLLAAGVSDIHELQKQSQLSAAHFNRSLTMLEINGKVRSHGSGHWSLS